MSFGRYACWIQCVKWGPNWCPTIRDIWTQTLELGPLVQRSTISTNPKPNAKAEPTSNPNTNLNLKRQHCGTYLHNGPSE